MKQQYTGVFLKTAILGILFYVVNSVLFYFSVLPDVQLHYPLYIIYLFFTLFSFFILGIITYVNLKNPAQTGYAFLLLTAVKMGASYVLAKPLLTKTIEIPTEKANFFVVFLLFLAIESYFTARLLNNKQ